MRDTVPIRQKRPGSGSMSGVGMYLVLSAVLLVAAQAAGAGANESPRIVVEGYGSVKTAPNVAHLSYEVRGDGATSDQAVGALVGKAAAIERTLVSIDSALDLRSESVRVQAVRPKDCAEEDYRDEVHLSTGECAIKGYVAVQDFSVRTSRVADAGTLVGLAGRRGAHNPKISDFGLADNREAKRQAIAKAMGDARAKAEAVAAGTGAKVGEILSVSLDRANDAEFIVVTGNRRMEPAAERDAPIQVNVSPSPVSTTAQVTVAYSILR